MKPLHVRAVMNGPIALPHNNEMHLDALLAWAWMARMHPDRIGLLARDATREKIIYAAIPVARLRVGVHRVPLCTSADYPPEARLAPCRWTRRKDGEDMNCRAQRIDSSSLERPLYVRGDKIETPHVDWLLWGTRREVMKLLDMVHHVGGLRGHGYGTVREWIVDEVGHGPRATVVDDAGRAARNLPAELITTTPHGRYAVEPPYWPPCMQVSAVKAGERVTLRDETETMLAAVQ